MDPLLLDYYNRELVYMRDAAGEFAAAHPKIARRLGMQAGDIQDPYVERLIESFSFMAARMQIKLDAEFPRFIERLLEVLHPQYVCPTPSMAVVRLKPNFNTTDTERGVRVPRGTAFKTQIPPGEVTKCEFRSSQPVELWPIRIVEARLTGVPPDLAGFASRWPAHLSVAGALRLRLTIDSGQETLNFHALRGLDRLSVYLAGDEGMATHLLELLHSSAIGTVTGTPGRLAATGAAVAENALVHEGLEPGEGLLPLDGNQFHGHNLLHEYFVCPERFWFFTLTGLAEGLSRIDGREAEIVVLLSRPPGELALSVDADQFALFCTPVINLFPGKPDQLTLGQGAEHHYQACSAAPLDYEVHSLQLLTGVAEGGGTSRSFRPLFQTLHADEGNHGRYFSVRRELRLASDTTRKYGLRAPYVGTEVFISLVDQHDVPYAESVKTLSVTAMLTNRDLPCMAPRTGESDLHMENSSAVASIGFIRPPTRPRPPYAQRELAWRLVRQLGFNHLPLTDLQGREGAQALRDMLRLFVSRGDDVQARQIDSLVGSRIAPVIRRLPGDGPLLYGRGVECTLTVDEDGFSGASPYLFGLVLERYLARHASVNVFSQTVLESMQRGTVARWPVRAGGRSVV